MARTTIRTEDITGSAVTGAKIASGAVPEFDDSGLQDDIALLGFKVAANGSLAKYDLVDQTIDAFEDASGVDASASTNEIRDSSGNYYSGTLVQTASTSGYTDIGAGTHTGVRTGTAEVLVVAGGGGGGAGRGDLGPGAGGGAGGLVHHATYSIVKDVVYDFTIGDGGSGHGGTTNGDVGDDSSWNDNAEGSALKMTALGGGGGMAYSGGTPTTGGSGGGTTQNSDVTMVASQGDSGGGTGYGENGGKSFNGAAGGGGGGAGAAGTPSSGNSNGGIGREYTNFDAWGTDSSNSASGSSGKGYFAGGGGGSRWSGTPGAGAAGGGGNGSISGGGTAAIDGTGGGGGSSYGEQGYNGGSGFVGIHYAASSVYNDMTLVSNSTTAESTPTKGDLVITYTDGAGTATINTDIKAYISRDGSAYTSAVTLASQGTSGGHKILTAHDVDLSGIASGTSMRWKIETLNQSVSKDTRVHAVSLGWS